MSISESCSTESTTFIFLCAYFILSDNSRNSVELTGTLLASFLSKCRVLYRSSFNLLLLAIALYLQYLASQSQVNQFNFFAVKDEIIILHDADEPIFTHNSNSAKRGYIGSSENQVIQIRPLFIHSTPVYYPALPSSGVIANVS